MLSKNMSRIDFSKTVPFFCRKDEKKTVIGSIYGRMNSLFIFFTVILLAIGSQKSIANSKPLVGDARELEGLLIGSGGGEIIISIKNEVIAIDEVNFLATLRNELSTEIHTEPQIEEEQTFLSHILTPENFFNAIAPSCETDMGGTLEEIVVPAGKFTTCKVVTEHLAENGARVILTTWFGPVPFGVVKIENIDEEENILRLELKSFKRGAP